MVASLLDATTRPDRPKVTGTQFERETRTMFQILRGLGRDERGEDLMEYGLLVAFVASVALAAVITDPLGLGTAVEAAYERAIDALNQA
jgi:Flp pilus assembly pilin Flp